MKSDTPNDWKASFKYELKCCLFGILYGLITAIALISFFSKYSVIALPICLIAFIGVIVWNIRSIKFRIKALLIEFPIAVGSFFIALLMWALTDPKPIISID